MSPTNEEAFEAQLAGWLVELGGYRRVKVGNVGGESDFDSVAGVDTADLFDFIATTQAGQWDCLLDSGYGGDETLARASFVQRLASQLDKRGTVDVLRRGVVDQNVTFRLAFLRPARGLTPELVERYEANVLSVTRQLRYEPSSNKTIDLGLFVNGIPVATAELKNPLTGQGVEHAILQYRKDRDPTNRTFRRVGMVHFAASVTVVTGHTEGWHHGLTVSAFTSVSLDPPVVLICIDHSSQSIKALRAAEGFTVNMFREGTGQVALRFASKVTDKFAGLVVEQPKHGAAGLCLPEESYASLECRTVESVEAGDHTIFVGHVEHANLYASARPLLYWQRRFRRILVE